MDITWNTVLPARPPTVTPSEIVLQEAVSPSSRLSGFLGSAATADEPVLLIVNDPHRSTQTRPALGAIAEHYATAGMGPRPSQNTARFNALFDPRAWRVRAGHVRRLRPEHSKCDLARCNQPGLADRHRGCANAPQRSRESLPSADRKRRASLLRRPDRPSQNGNDRVYVH